MEQFRIQAALMCVAVVLGLPLRGEAEWLTWNLGYADVTFCGNATVNTCDAHSYAIRSLMFTGGSLQDASAGTLTTKWTPDLAQSQLRLYSLPIRPVASDSWEVSIQASKELNREDEKAWISELTCNLVPIKIAKYNEPPMGRPRKIVGTYEATVSQACYFKIENSHIYQGMWFPKEPNPTDMALNKTWKAKDGWQIYGVEMEYGAGNLTGIPMNVLEFPIPFEPSSLTTTSSVAPAHGTNWLALAFVTALVVGSLVACVIAGVVFYYWRSSKTSRGIRSSPESSQV